MTYSHTYNSFTLEGDNDYVWATENWDASAFTGMTLEQCAEEAQKEAKVQLLLAIEQIESDFYESEETNDEGEPLIRNRTLAEVVAELTEDLPFLESHLYLWMVEAGDDQDDDEDEEPEPITLETIEDASHVTKVITSQRGNIIAVIEEHDITPTFTAPGVLDEFDDTYAIVPVLPSQPTTLPTMPAVIEAAIDTPKRERIDYLQDEAALASLFATLSQLPNITLMLVGTWVWVDGDTKPVKEQLKKLGFKWHQKKVMWYMALNQQYHKTRHNADWSTIAMRYGVRTLKTND